MRTRFSALRFRVLFASLAAALAGCNGAPSTTGEVLASGSVMANGPLAVGSSSLFFVDTSTISLSRIPVTGGAPTALDPNPPSIDFMAVDATHVFYGGSYNQAGTIRRVSQTSGAPETLATTTGFMGGMTVSGGRVYWITEDVDASDAADDAAVGTGKVFSMAVPTTGEPEPTPTVLAEKLPFPCALASDDANLYWLDCASDELLSVPLASTATTKPATLASGLGLAADTFGVGTVPLAAAGGHVYWTLVNDASAEANGGTVFTVPSTGGTPSVVAVRNDWDPAELLADATEVYWRTNSNYGGPSGDGPDVNDRDPGLWSARAGGGSVTQVLGGDAQPLRIAMDAGFLYWIDGADLSLRRAAR